MPSKTAYINDQIHQMLPKSCTLYARGWRRPKGFEKRFICVCTIQPRTRVLPRNALFGWLHAYANACRGMNLGDEQYEMPPIRLLNCSSIGGILAACSYSRSIFEGIL
jgi:hypothetical protein